MSVKGALVAAGVPSVIATREAPHAEKAMRSAHIDTQVRAEYFLAQVLHESLLLIYDHEIASGAAYEGRHDLGNIHPGDGVRFRGRGWIMITGRANYGLASRALGIDLINHPELASRHDIAWRIAAWYWTVRGINSAADRHDFVRVTELINGGRNGLAQRQHFLSLVSRVDCRPIDPWQSYTATEIRWIKEYDKLKKSNTNLARRRALQRAMTAQRKRIWQAAQGAGGWEAANRRKRYHSLLARTS
jgi:predicted chitinase